MRGEHGGGHVVWSWRQVPGTKVLTPTLTGPTPAELAPGRRARLTCTALTCMKALGPSREGVGQGAGTRGEESGDEGAEGVLGTRCALPACRVTRGGERGASLGMAPRGPHAPSWMLARGAGRRGAGRCTNGRCPVPAAAQLPRVNRPHLQQRAVGPPGNAVLAAQPLQDGEACSEGWRQQEGSHWGPWWCGRHKCAADGA